MEIKIKILDSVHCQAVGDIELLKPLLSCNKVFWRRGKFGKRKKIQYRSYLIDKEGIFLTGFLPKIKTYCKRENIPLVIKGKLEKLKFQSPKLSGITFRQDQMDAIENAGRFQRGVIKAPTRAGKSIIIMGIFSAFPKGKFLLVAHTLEIVSQLQEDVTRFGFSNRVDVGTIQTWSRKNPEEFCDKYDGVIVDECFSKSSLVKVVGGSKVIQDIKVGDFVWSGTGVEKIVHTFRKRVLLSRIVKLTLTNKKIIFCSKEHPFFTMEGLVEARYLKKKILIDFSFVITYIVSNIILTFTKEMNNEKDSNNKEMFALWKFIYSGQLGKRKEMLFKKLFPFTQKTRFETNSLSNMQQDIFTKERGTKILFKSLFLQKPRTKSHIVKDNEKNQFEKERNNKRENEKKQSYVKSKNLGKNDKYQKNQWNFKCLVRGAWRQWKIYRTSDTFSCCFGLANGGDYSFGSRSSSWSKEKIYNQSWLSYKLQSGYWKQKIKNWYRGRWKTSFLFKGKDTGPEKDSQIKSVRVENIEVYQRGNNDGAFQSIISDRERNQGFVEFYDLEVENSHSYFVENILVHNCHHVGNLTGHYTKLLHQMLAPLRIGFTATLQPHKENQMTLEGTLGPVIGELTMQEAAEKGIIARPKIRLIKVPKNDKVRRIRKYQDVYEAGIVFNRARNRLIVKEARKLIKEDNTVLILVVRIAHGDALVELAKRLYEMDIPFVQGATDSEVRLGVKKALGNKKEKCVIATAVFREGINIPSLNSVINGCGGKSEVMTLQAVGRGLTVVEGKKESIIIDFLDLSHHYLISHIAERLSLYSDMRWL